MSAGRIKKKIVKRIVNKIQKTSREDSNVSRKDSKYQQEDYYQQGGLNNQ